MTGYLLCVLILVAVFNIPLIGRFLLRLSQAVLIVLAGLFALLIVVMLLAVV